MIAVTNSTHFDVKINSAGYSTTHIDLAAPGESIYSCIGDSSYSHKSGTSMAAPHVAGAIGLMYASACSSVISLSKLSPDSAARLMRFLILDAVDVLSSMSSFTVSKGRLNVFNSVLRSTCDYLWVKDNDIQSNFNIYYDQLNEEVKLAQDKRNKELKRLDLLDNQLTKLDRDRMTLGNRIADIVRDLPIIDFLDPKLKVQQTVVSDVKYDVNFTTVPVVDRCVSCHMGIEDSQFSDQHQPYKSHPNLELIGASSSPHPFNEFGCTSCHSGRSRGTGFVSTVHMPNNHEQEEQWEEDYDWEKMHHWLQPMLPSEYSQAGCFQCHTKQPYLEGGDKLQLGITLIKQNGCNACHLIENLPKENNVGPDLTKVDQKFDKEWAFKWIKNPQSFRYDTRMPHFFEQDNNSSPDMIQRNNAEIYAITEYLFQDNNYQKTNDRPYIGDLENGQILFEAIGCMGCHKIDQTPSEYKPKTHEYDFYLSNHGYDDEEVTNYSILNQL